jgi:DNA processing protein
VLDLSAAVALSVLPGARGAALLTAFRAQSPARPLAAFRLDAALDATCPAQAGATLAAAQAAAAPLLEDLAAGRRRAVVFGAASYPPRLAAIPDPPPLLWINGDETLLAQPVIAIVGSRYASPSSLDVAHTLARDLAGFGLVVVSGLARGVDAAAHRGALEGGRTIGVLGSGLDRIYPPEHRPLAEVIVASGAIVSELAPSAPPTPEHFPRRNRIISGLALGVVVVEASLRSGSLITARCAADQGREVMAVPGTALGQRHKGSHSLIRDGAALVETAEDVVAALGLTLTAAARDAAGAAAGADGGALSSGAADPYPPADPILAALDGGEALSLARLEAATGLSTADLLARLTVHEMAGRIARLPGGAFRTPPTAVVR